MGRVIALFLVGLSQLLAPAVSRPHSGQLDDRVLRAAALRLAHQTPGALVRWLQRQPNVQSAGIGLDHQTVGIRFRDGTPGEILPASPHAARLVLPDFRRRVRGAAYAHTQAGRALVLEPFATDQIGPDGGHAETLDLQAAGFQVDVVKDAAVTVRLMQTLSPYNVVYIQTHGGVNQYGEAALATGEPVDDDPQLVSLFQNYELAKAGVAGSSTVYWALLSRFIQHQMGQFPRNALLYVDTCDLLRSPLWWQALSAKGVGAMVSWDRNAEFRDDIPTAARFFGSMLAGASVDGALKAVVAAGYGTSVDSTSQPPQTAHLGYHGDGGITLQNAVSGAPTGTPPTPRPATPPTATATPVPTPTAGPTKTPTPPPLLPPALSVDLERLVAPGARQIVRMRTNPGSAIHVQVRFPNGDRQSAVRTAGVDGSAAYQYLQRASKITHDRVWAHVLVGTAQGQQTRTIERSYRIMPGTIDVSAEPRQIAPGGRVTIWVHTRAFTAVTLALRLPTAHLILFRTRTGPKGWAHHAYRPDSLSGIRGTVRVTATIWEGNRSHATQTTFTIQ